MARRKVYSRKNILGKVEEGRLDILKFRKKHESNLINETYVFNNADEADDSSLLNMILFGAQNISLWDKYVEVEEVRNSSSTRGDLQVKSW